MHNNLLPLLRSNRRLVRRGRFEVGTAILWNALVQYLLVVLALWLVTMTFGAHPSVAQLLAGALGLELLIAVANAGR